MSDDTKDLVKRLRRWYIEGGLMPARDAADAIERLDRRIDVQHATIMESVAQQDRLFARIAELERELAEAHEIERSDGEVRRELDGKLAEIERDRDALTAPPEATNGHI